MLTLTTAAGVTFNVPEPDDSDYGPETTRLLAYILNAAINGGPLIAALMTYTPIDLTVNAGDTIVPTSSYIRIKGSAPGENPLNLTNALAPAQRDGTIVILQQNDANNIVSIIDNSGNIDINGDWEPGLYESIQLIWNAPAGKWNEITRTA